MGTNTFALIVQKHFINSELEKLELGNIDMIDRTLQKRGETYGRFSDNAEIAQRLKRVVRDGVKYSELPFDVCEAFDMILSKISRAVTADYKHLDTYEDIQGYAKLVQDRLKEDSEMK